MPGVKAIYHRANVGKLFRVVPNEDFSAYTDEERPPFEDDTIRYFGQYVALVVADTFEQATAAAECVKVSYNEKKPNVSRKLTADDGSKVESHRGDAEKAFRRPRFSMMQLTRRRLKRTVLSSCMPAWLCSTIPISRCMKLHRA